MHPKIVRNVLAAVALPLLAGCSGSYAVDRGGVGVYPDPVVTAPVYDRVRGVRSAAALDIPEGHYPPPGSCRVWFLDRPAGQQPPPSSCYVRVPPGAVLIRG